MYTTVPPVLVGAVLGVVAHHGLFIHGEWHIQAPSVLVTHLAGFFYLALVVKAGWQIISGYLLALSFSILIYRVFFHRLKHFQSPFLASTSKIWHVWEARDSKNHFFLQELYRECGDFVRTGPSEITVFHPGVFMAVDGPSSKCGRAEWYDLLHPNTGLVTTREKELHRERRGGGIKVPTAALAQYKSKILPPLNQLDDCLKADIVAGQASNVSNLVFWLTFDRMGEFVLGRSFDMLRNQQWHSIILLLQKAMSLLGPLGPTPWAVQIAFKLMPRVGVLRDWFTMVGWCENQVRKIPVRDSISAIVAGSEPTASTLIGLIYELAKQPSQAEKLRNEILQTGAYIHDSSSLARYCPHLEAAIFEALRLYPSIPSAGNRKMSSNEGVTVAGIYIPLETTVVAPRFVIGRREDCFENADAFVPERWTTSPEMVPNRAAFAPCIGRALAMNDLMLVTAHIVYYYWMRFPPGETGDSVIDDWKDNFTSTLGQLSLMFELRGD
ncbi:cytochrome P450 [Aspergillus undulatus]|uniref:cytochrome P450 n=1 Tax=Aspergillus undulatus TaxID=1810928 RepID=UPI003CCCED8D